MGVVQKIVAGQRLVQNCVVTLAGSGVQVVANTGLTVFAFILYFIVSF